MTTQPRGVSAPGTHPSQPLIIPNKFNQFGPNQAYSPNRHPGTSSPLQQHYYPQGGISGGSHDAQHLYKSPGVAGTSPAQVMMMQPQMYSANGQRPRAMPPMMANPNTRYYYSNPNPMVPRYQSPQPGPTTSPSYYQNQSPFQYMQGQQMGQQQHPLYPANPYISPQYNVPPPQQTTTPLQQPPSMMHQQQSTGPKQRVRKIITIKDPTTNKDVTSQILKNSRLDSQSTPPSGRSSATPPTSSDVSAEFAAKVAAAIGNTSKTGSSPLVNQRSETPPLIMNQSPAMMQMQETQIVGSPGMNAQMVPPPTYIGMPQIPTAPSPRPPTHQMMMQQYGPPGHVSAPMLSSSPSHVMASHSPMSMPPTMNEPPQTHPAAYQLPPQPYVSSPMTGHAAQIRSENVHTFRPQQANVTTSEQTVILAQRPQRPPIRPMVPHSQQNTMPVPQEIQQPPVVQQSQIAATVSVPAQHEANVKSAVSATIQPRSESVVASTTVSSIQPQVKENTVKEVVQSEEITLATSTDQTLNNDAAAKAQLVTDVASIEKVSEKPQSSEQVKPAGDVSAELLENVKTEIVVELSGTLPSETDKLEQVPEKEDTAIRLTEELPVQASVIDKVGDENKATVAAKVSAETSSVSKDSKASVPVVDEVKASVTDKTTHPLTPMANAEKEEPSSPASELSKHAPQVNIVPATPPSKISESKKEEEMPPSKISESKKEEEITPIPSAKVAVQKTDSKPEPVQTQTKAVESSAAKSVKVATPEPPKVVRGASPDPKNNKAVKKETTDNIQKQIKSEQIKQTAQKQTVVVNGVSTEASSESDSIIKKPQKVSDPVPTTHKTSKILETKPTSETKSADPKPASTTAKTSSVSSEKSSSVKPIDSEKTNGVTSEKKKPIIKYDSGIDQWSPLNPEGKKQYDSNFLLQFQYKPTSLEKPKDLPNIDIVLEQPHKKIAAPMQPMELRGGGSDFTPGYMQRRDQRGSQRQRSLDHRRPGRGSMSGPMGGPKIIPKVVSIDRTEVELKRAANAWKPVKMDSSSTGAPGKKEELDVERSVRSILNKLTPSTFPELVKQVLALKIDKENKLRRAIDLIFEKAIDEPGFCEVYAKLCRNMTALHVLPETQPGQEQPPTQPVEFRKLLLTKCQREFEKNKSDQEHLLELKKKMKANTNMEIAPQLKEEYEVAETKERRRSLGNIRFIGELYKLRMLTENIMHSCIMSLFKGRDDEHHESLCRLLTTIGKDLDHVKGKQRMDQYFEQISRVISLKQTSSRVRFMLQDVFDLRLNMWTPRAITTQGPKTITQIHQDAKDEQALLQLKIANAGPVPPQMNKGQGGRQGNRMGSRGHGGDDGWTKVQTPKPTRYDPTKMKLKSNTFDDVNKVTLGPPTRGFGGWKSGSGGSGVTKSGSGPGPGSYSPSASMEKTTPDTGGRSNTPTSMMNRFSVFGQAQGENEYQRRQAGRQSSREGTRSGSRGSMGPPSGGRTPGRDERTLLLETARKLTSTDGSYNARQNSSRESSPSLKPRPSTPQPPVHKYNTDLDEDKMQTKSKSIIEEFLSIVDYKEATECIDELNAPPTMMYSLVSVAHECSLEKNFTARTNVGKLMTHLLKRGKLSVEQYGKGLAEILEMASDVEIDVPKVWEYFAEQISPVFEDEKESDVPLTCLVELATPLQGESRSLIFVAEIVKAVLKRVPVPEFVERWQRSNMSWSKILGKNDKQIVDEFLSKHKLEEFSESVDIQAEETSLPSSREDLQYRYEQNITKLLESNSNNEKIFEWVEANIPQGDIVKPIFIRALTMSICRNAIDMKSMVVFKDKMEEWSIVLKKYIENNTDRELQALFGLQQLMVDLEQPPNVLRAFFDILYDKDVIIETSFYNWEKSEDPNEQEGRGVALASANPFLTWLRSAEPESD